MNPLEYLVQLLMGSAQPRPDLGQAGPTATFAGRLVPQGQVDLASLLAQPQAQSPDEGFSLAAMGAMPGIMAGLRIPTQAEAQALAKLIIERGQRGAPMVRQAFRPMVETRSGQQVLGSQGGFHGDLAEKLTQLKPQELNWGFATPEGIPVSDPAFSLLTGPPAQLQAAASLLQQGASLEDILMAILQRAGLK